MESMKKERALSTNLFIGSMLFLVALFAAVVAVNFFVQKKTIYGIHEREMAEVIRYVESYIDKDDLYHCFKTGKTSEKYDRLQEFMDRFIDNYGLHYLYLIHPEKTAEGYRAVNIICGNTMYEKKHLQAAVLSLGDVDPQITDEKVIRQ